MQPMKCARLIDVLFLPATTRDSCHSLVVALANIGVISDEEMRTAARMVSYAGFATFEDYEASRFK